MTKKYSAIICATLFILFFAISVEAEGIFSSVVKAARENEPNPLPSFSVYSHLPYDKSTSDNEKITYSYSGISLKMFEDFGIYLEKQNYCVINSENTETAFILEIGVNEKLDASGSYDKTFVIAYDTQTLKLDMVYPLNVKIQECSFLNTMPFGAKAEKLITDSTSDHFGNKYVYSIGIDEGSVSIPTNALYTNFTGTIAYPGEREYDSYRESASLVIYGDGESLYESPDVDIATYPIHFSVDISGCKVVEIVWSSMGSNMWKNWGYNATIYNGMFY